MLNMSLESILYTCTPFLLFIDPNLFLKAKSFFSGDSGIRLRSPWTWLLAAVRQRCLMDSNLNLKGCTLQLSSLFPHWPLLETCWFVWLLLATRSFAQSPTTSWWGSLSHCCIKSVSNYDLFYDMRGGFFGPKKSVLLCSGVTGSSGHPRGLGGHSLCSTNRPGPTSSWLALMLGASQHADGAHTGRNKSPIVVISW